MALVKYTTLETVIFFVFDRFTTTNWSAENLYIFRIKSCFQKVVEALQLRKNSVLFYFTEYINTGGTFKLLIRELEVLIKKIIRLESQQTIISDRHESDRHLFLQLFCSTEKLR